MTLALAFYKGRGDWRDALIRWVTRSPYSHVELATGQVDLHGRNLCWSASPRDGGVRNRWIDLDSDHWDVLPVAFVGDMDWSVLFGGQSGLGYDWFGLVFSQFFNLRRQRANRWFCSEICAAALGLPSPEKYSPGDLHAMVGWLNGRVLSTARPNTKRAHPPP